jgi:RNA polymerase sigma-70 factor (ECF subfamily)
MSGDADRQLISRILEGGENGRAAFKDLYDRYQKQVYSLCYRLMGDAHRAADAAQESFLAVLRGLESFEFHSSFRTWLFQVTKNAALQQVRKASSRTHLSLDEPGDKGEEAGEPREAVDLGRPGLLDRAIEGEFARDLQEALDRLKRPHAEILSLRYFSDLSYEELAEVLGCSIGTVKSRLNRAHRALRPFLLDVMKKHGRTVADSDEAGPDL